MYVLSLRKSLRTSRELIPRGQNRKPYRIAYLPNAALSLLVELFLLNWYGRIRCPLEYPPSFPGTVRGTNYRSVLLCSPSPLSLCLFSIDY